MRGLVVTGIPPTKSPLAWVVEFYGPPYTALVSTVPDGTQNVGDITELKIQTLDNLKQVMTETGGSTADVI